MEEVWRMSRAGCGEWPGEEPAEVHCWVGRHCGLVGTLWGNELNISRFPTERWGGWAVSHSLVAVAPGSWIHRHFQKCPSWLTINTGTRGVDHSALKSGEQRAKHLLQSPFSGSLHLGFVSDCKNILMLYSLSSVAFILSDSSRNQVKQMLFTYLRWEFRVHPVMVAKYICISVFCIEYYPVWSLSRYYAK